MIRQSSIDAYNEIKPQLPRRQAEILSSVWEEFLTANEICRSLPKDPNITHHNIHTNLLHMRKNGTVKEGPRRVCNVSGRKNLTFRATQKPPIKWEEPHREPCKQCGGKGYIETQQGKFDV